MQTNLNHNDDDEAAWTASIDDDHDEAQYADGRGGHARDGGGEHPTFSSFSEIPRLSRDVLRGLVGLGFERPSPVQAAAIPALLDGRDVVAEAPSGSGKTAAFAVPSLQCVDPSLDETQVLILTPTRVLGEQIGEVVRDLAKFMPGVRVASLLSGSHVNLRPSPHVVVAVAPSRHGPSDRTPDKLIDLVEKGMLRLDRLRVLVLDEADDLLDRPEFQEGVRMVLTALPVEGTQVAMFSATFTASALTTARKIAREGDDLVLVHPEDDTGGGGGGGRVRPAIQHRYVRIGPRTDHIWEERGACCEELSNMFAAASNIIFVRTRKQLEFLAQAFEADGPNSPYTTQLARFRRGHARVLIATDACGRGIDVQGVAVVINFELPTQLEFGSKCAATEKYIQRAGRAGRFGRAGVCITLVDDSEAHDLDWLQTRTGLTIKELDGNMESLPGYGQTRPEPAEATREVSREVRVEPSKMVAEDEEERKPKPVAEAVVKTVPDERRGNESRCSEVAEVLPPKLDEAAVRAEVAATVAAEVQAEVRAEVEADARAEADKRVREVEAAADARVRELQLEFEQNEAEMRAEADERVREVEAAADARVREFEQREAEMCTEADERVREVQAAANARVHATQLDFEQREAEMCTQMELGRAREAELLHQIQTLTTDLSRVKAEDRHDGDGDDSFYVGSVWCTPNGGGGSGGSSLEDVTDGDDCGGSSGVSIGSSQGSQASEASEHTRSTMPCVAVAAVRVFDEEAASTLSAGSTPRDQSSSAPPSTRFGKGTIDAAKLVAGERFVGEVVKVLQGGSVAFVKFGDGSGVCSKDGALRRVPDVAVGTRVRVAVKEVKTKMKRGAREAQVELVLA